MVKWNENLAEWRDEHNYNSKDWNEYASARTDQANIMAACCFAMGLVIGYFGGR